jgi:putative ABC transport system ATP-binding protein
LARPSPGDVAGRSLLREIRTRHRRRVLLASVLFVTHQVGELLVPVLAGITVDRAVVGSDEVALGRWLLILALVFAVLSTAWRFADRTISRSMEEVGHEIRLDLATRAIAHRGIADRPPAGQVVSVASSDVTAVMGYPEALFLWAGSGAGLIAVAAVVLWVSVPLGLLILLGLPPVLLLLQVLTAPIERRLSVQQEEVGRAAAIATDLLRGLRPLKGLHAEREAAQRYRRASRRSLTAGLHATRLIAGQQGMATVVTGGFVAVIALVAGRQAADGTITVGQLIAAVGATQFLVGPLGWVASATTMRASARASATRVAALLDAPAAVAEQHPLVAEGTGPDGIERDVPVLMLDGVEHAPLRGIDLSVPNGSLVVIASGDPASAAALVALLGRWADPVHGTISLDGRDLTALPIDELRRTILVSEHEAALFDGTVRAAVDGRSADDALDAVLAAAGVDEMLDALPDGLDTRIGTGAWPSRVASGSGSSWPGPLRPTGRCSSCTNRPRPSMP